MQQKNSKRFDDEGLVINMGTGCSSQSKRPWDFRRKWPSDLINRYEWSTSEMRPPSAHDFNQATVAAGASLMANGLSLIDVHLLRRTWPSNSIEQSYEIGLEIFEEAFRLEPNVKNYFPGLREVDASMLDVRTLRCVGDFQGVVIRAVSMLALCIKYCDQPQHLDERLFEMGQQHRKCVPDAPITHFRVFEKALTMVIRRRMEQVGLELGDDSDSGYGSGVSCQTVGHPSSLDDGTAIMKFRNPKEQIKANIAWTCLAAYISKQIWTGFRYAADTTDKTRADAQDFI